MLLLIVSRSESRTLGICIPSSFTMDTFGFATQHMTARARPRSHDLPELRRTAKTIFIILSVFDNSSPEAGPSIPWKKDTPSLICLSEFGDTSTPASMSREANRDLINTCWDKKGRDCIVVRHVSVYEDKATSDDVTYDCFSWIRCCIVGSVKGKKDGWTVEPGLTEGNNPWLASLRIRCDSACVMVSSEDSVLEKAWQAWEERYLLEVSEMPWIKQVLMQCRTMKSMV